ncbi:MAG: tetratricopeptide repeat protein [Gammaproteobacteria bacterium]|nr:tetratricopeptide repeat protein [Gammaproteobacteria bacterium]
MTRLLRQRRRLPTRGASVLAGLALFVLTGLVLVPNNMASEIEAELPWPDLGSFEPAVAEALSDGRQELERALGAASSEQESGSAYGELGRLYLAHHLLYAAEAVFSRAIAYDPNKFLWNYLLGYTQQEQGKHAEAIRRYRKALLIDPGHATTAFRLAQSELSDGRESAAKKSFESLLDRQPKHVAALAGLARIAIRQRDYQRAIGLLSRALQLNPAANQLHYPLAQALRQTGQMEAAKRQLAIAGQTRPQVEDPVLTAVESLSRSGQLYLERGLALLRAGKDSMAVAQIQRAVALNPDDAYALATLGHALQLAGRIGEAAAAFERALALGLDDPSVHYRFGMALESLDQQEGADEQYVAALLLDDSLREARLMLANSMMRAGRYADAETHYRLLATADKGTAVFWYRLALANLAQQDCRGAIAALDQAVAIAPSDGDLLQALARAYSVCAEVTGERKQHALELARLIHDARPGVDTLETLAMASAANRSFEDARVFQTQAMLSLRQSPGRPDNRIDHLRSVLTRYEKGQPAVIAYSPDDPVMNPQVRRR